ncbi:MAG: 2-succinyl-5-enolpyruvyl-6-hydroxy-3-cyclohexene-1-carboxylate synthase, partial [Planctomycetia bacterium]
SVASVSNVGGFGIDGGLSSLLGASLANQDKLYFGVMGDLAFFYDLNAMGNRHKGNNLRILLVNNGKGTEFKHFDHHAAYFDEGTDEFIAAARHFGNKSQMLVKHFAQDLGFEYLSAANKEEFEQVYERFLTAEITERPMLFEVFTDSSEESEALKTIVDIEQNVRGLAKETAKQFLGEKGKRVVKKMMGR